ncbi:MAG: hypothetical protein ACTSQA_00780 [Candidatus Heimdallarchaeaceae archaeon]
MKNNIQSEDGVAILLSVMILSIILSIALGSSDIAIRQVQSMKGIGDSVVAFYAADHGIELTMAMEHPYSIEETELLNGATYVVTVVESSASSTSCSSDDYDYCISSIGSFNEAKRAIWAAY